MWKTSIFVSALILTPALVAAQITFKEECLTDSGPNPYEACIFPFFHRGREYQGCTCDYSNAGEPAWCSTKVDENGIHVTGHFGYCSANGLCPNANPDCGITSNPSSSCLAEDVQTGVVKPCVFPFRYNDKIYTSCTTDYSEDGLPWCSTQTTSDGENLSQETGRCQQGCQSDQVLLLPGVRLTGGFILSSYNRADSPEVCQAKCEVTPECGQWVWNVHFEECSLSTLDCAEAQEPNQSHFSGYTVPDPKIPCKGPKKPAPKPFGVAGGTVVGGVGVAEPTVVGGSVPSTSSGTLAVSRGVRREGNYCCKPCWRFTPVGWRAFSWKSPQCLQTSG